MTAFQRTLSGSNKSTSTSTAYRPDLAQFARFLAETNCTIASPADITRTDVSEFLALSSTRSLGPLRVKVRRYPERLPLRAVVVVDDQRHVFALDQIEQLPCAGAELRFVVHGSKSVSPSTSR